MPIPKTSLLFLPLALAALLPVAPVRADAPPLPKVIRLADVGANDGKAIGVGLITLAKEKGFFDEEFKKDGIDTPVTYYIGSGPVLNEVVAQGDTDFTNYGSLPNVIGLAGGIPAKVVSIALRHPQGKTGYYIAVRPDSPIQTIADLRGKKIAGHKGSQGYMDFILHLESAGIQEKDINLVNLDGPDATAAFDAGAVDAIAGASNLLALRDKGKVRLIYFDQKISQETSINGYLVNDTFEKNYPELVERVVKVLVKTAWWASQDANRAEVLAFLSRTSIDPKYIAEDLDGVSFKERYSPILDAATLDGYKRTTDFAVAHKLVRRDAAYSDAWFEPKYVEQALKDLNLEGYWESHPAEADAPASAPANSVAGTTAAP